VTSLELVNVSRAFGGLRAVQGVNLKVLPGRITGLIGPNGAGKTTIINLVTGLLWLSSGRVVLDDLDVTQMEPYDVARAGIARTFQNVRLLKEASVVENVLAGYHLHDATSSLAKFLGLPSVRRQEATFRERVDKLLADFDMTAMRDQLAGELSYGHQRRVEIMRALAMEPRVLLLDEPAAGMNDAEAEALGALFRRLAQSGIAVLLVEHNMRLMMRLCDEIYVLSAGEIIASGPPEQIRSDARVVEAYLGS
jgi:branched-chain amino acid transport system ATP-binding protein